jgi:hypothetical protein
LTRAKTAGPRETHRGTPGTDATPDHGLPIGTIITATPRSRRVAFAPATTRSPGAARVGARQCAAMPR